LSLDTDFQTIPDGEFFFQYHFLMDYSINSGVADI